MATIRVCDRCKTQEGVAAGQYDLCAPCAVGVLDRLLNSEIPDVRASVVAECGALPVKAGEPAKPAMPLSDQEREKQAHGRLTAEHDCKIFSIQPAFPIAKLPCQGKYGPPKEECTVEVLEAVPGKPGHYFAKIVL